MIGIGAVDPALQGQAAALAEAERAVRTLGLAGLDIEPGFGEPANRRDSMFSCAAGSACSMTRGAMAGRKAGQIPCALRKQTVEAVFFLGGVGIDRQAGDRLVPASCTIGQNPIESVI